MIIVRLLSPGPWLVGTTKVYPGVGADIVMESITLIENWMQRNPEIGSGPEVLFWEITSDLPQARFSPTSGLPTIRPESNAIGGVSSSAPRVPLLARNGLSELLRAAVPSTKSGVGPLRLTSAHLVNRHF